MLSRTLLFAVVFAALGTLSTPAMAADKDWLTDIKKAKAQAKKEGKVILLEFTGSDWCPPCKMLTKTVLSTPKFKKWAKKHAVLLYLDFPSRKPISADQKKHNAKLQKKYGIQGYPTIVITDADGKEIGRKVGGSNNPDAYIKALSKIVAKAKPKATSKPASRPSK